jgi:hypothetical protein
MKDGFLDRYGRWRRRLDLDDARMSAGDLEVLVPESGRRTPRRMAVLLLQRVLRQTLDDECVATNLFYDSEDDCLRGLEYSGADGTSEAGSREFLRAPGCSAKQVLEELRWRSGVGDAPGEGTLH